MSITPPSIISAVAIATLSAIFAAPSVVPPSGPPGPVQDPMVELSAGTHSAEEIVRALAKLTGSNVLIDEAAIVGSSNGITLQTPINLARGNVWTVVENLLYAQDLHIVPLSEGEKLFEVINSRGSRRGELTTRAKNMTPEQVLANRDRKIQVQCVLPLEHTKASMATNALRPYFSNTGHTLITIGNPGNERSLLLSGCASRVAAVIDMVVAADIAPKNPAAALPPAIPAINKRLRAIEKRLDAIESREATKDRRD